MFAAMIRCLLVRRPIRYSLTGRQRSVLCLESLEHRELPAAIYVWTGADHKINNLNWSDQNNWRVGGQVPAAPPGANDTVLFDDTGAPDDGRIYDSVDDVAATSTVFDLYIYGTYTGTITLNQDLSVYGAPGIPGYADIAGGTITGNHNLYIADDPPTGPPAYPATLYWLGTAIQLGDTNKVLLGRGGSGNIGGKSQHALDGCIFVNHSSNLTWDCQGDIALLHTAYFYAASGPNTDFALTANAAGATGAVTGSSFERFIVNPGGTFDVNATQTPTATIRGVTLQNYGIINVNQGSLVCTTATTQNYATINVKQGSLVCNTTENYGTITLFPGA
jgi:hypothetical protein